MDLVYANSVNIFFFVTDKIYNNIHLIYIVNFSIQIVNWKWSNFCQQEKNMIVEIFNTKFIEWINSILIKTSWT